MYPKNSKIAKNAKSSESTKRAERVEKWRGNLLLLRLFTKNFLIRAAHEYQHDTFHNLENLFCQR